MKITLDWSFELAPMLRTRTMLFVVCAPLDSDGQVTARTAIMRDVGKGHRSLIDCVSGEVLGEGQGVYAWALADAPSLQQLVEYNTEKRNRRPLEGRGGQ